MDEVTEASLVSIHASNRLGETQPRSDTFGKGDDFSSLPRTGVAPVLLGEAATQYRRSMRTLFKGERKLIVFHGTSARNARDIVTAGFGVSYYHSGSGVFVKIDKGAVYYSVEHADTPEGAAVVEAELYLKGKGYTRRGGTIIVRNPLLLVPLKVHFLTSHDMTEEAAVPMPPMLRRER